MTTADIREQLHEQIDRLPDDVVERIAEFTLFLMVRRHITPSYADWDQNEWQAFALQQFVREDDDVEYSLDDAEEVYHP